MKEIGYQNKSKVSAKIVLEFEGNRYYENNEVDSHFNTFFTEVAAKLVSELPNPSGLYDVNSESLRTITSTLRGVEWVHCLFLFPFVLGKM